MTNERFAAIVLLIQTLSTIIIGVVGFCYMVMKYLKLLETKAVEKSVGASKIKELEKENDAVKEDIKVLHQVSSACKKEIGKLEEDYEKLIDHIWGLLGKK